MTTKLKDIKITEGSLVDKGANPKAKVLLFKWDDSEDISKTVKTEDGKEYPASDYAYVPDAEKSSTWKLRLTSTPGGEPDAKIIGAAIAALGVGFRGNKVEIPAEDLPKVKAKVRVAWKKANPDKANEDMPAVIKSEGIIDKAIDKAKEFLKMMGMPYETAGSAKDLNSIVSVKETEEKLWDLSCALRESVESIISDESVTDKQGAIAVSLQQFLSQIISSGIAKEGKAISNDRMNVLTRTKEMLDNASKMMEEMMDEANKSKNQENDMTITKGDDSMLSEEARKTLPDEVNKYISDLEEKTKLEKKDEEDVLKGASEEVRKTVEDLRKKVEEADGIAKVERELRVSKEYIEKAKKYPNIGNSEDISKMLRTAYEQDEEVGKKLEETFKAANERIEKGGLFKEFGRSSGGDDNSESKLNSLAKVRAEKDGITFEKAYNLVMETPEGISLYSEMKNERSVQ